MSAYVYHDKENKHVLNGDTHSSTSLTVTKPCDSQSSCTEAVAAKHPEPGDVAGSSDLNASEVFFKCTTSVRKESVRCVVEMTWIDGEKKELMQQMMQFFINRFVPPRHPLLAVSEINSKYWTFYMLHYIEGY